MTTMTQNWLLRITLAALFAGCWSTEAATIYVNAAAAGTNDGSSWTDAHTSLQAALAAANSGDEAWVAAGTYKPTADTDRDATFELVDGVALYGGFAGTETARNQRDWAANATILSGDLNGDDNANIDVDEPTRQDNVYYVVRGSEEASAAILDGFTVTGGNKSGMYNLKSSPTIANCTFSANAANPWGGGMFNSDESSPTISDCTFSGNSAAYNGGGMSNYLSSSPTITGCTFSGNSARWGGGLSNASASSPTVSNCTFSTNAASVWGGGIYSDGSSPTISNGTFTGNSADWGGGLANYLSSSPTISNCTFTGNSATTGGGGAYNYESSPAISDCTFSQNTATTGGGMLSSSSSPTITNGTFSDNTATAEGGGMSNRGSSPTITNSTFSDNSANVGGGMENGESSSSAISNCTFSTNAAAWGAGMENSNSSPTISNCTFSNNPATTTGGGMDNYQSSPTIDNCTFSGNSATEEGGGMSNRSSSPAISNCTFSSNSAAWGGAVDNGASSSPTISNCTFSSNSASWGGAMENGGSSPTISNCTFSGNSATRNGGGMDNYQSSPTLGNCTFSRNSATEEGGGMSNYDSSPTITNSSFSGNSAATGGGMESFWRSSPTISNSIFWGNTASGDGNQLWNSDAFSIPTLRHCDVAGSGGSASWDTSFGTDLGGNIDANPLFTNGGADDLTLLAGSPAIDAADGALTPTYDARNFGRYDDPATANTGADAPNYADLGPFEYQGSAIAPAITQQPQSQTMDPGQRATFSVSPTGSTPLTHQWRKNGVDIAGAVSATYTIASVQESDEGNYDCVVTNAFGAAASNVAVLAVNDPPAITAQPQWLTKNPGESATFTVVATGTAPLSYQWRKGGANIGGATAASYTIASVQESDEGSFDCVVANTVGTAASNAATLTVNDPPAAPTGVTARPLAAFGKIVLKWDPVAGATGYRIYYDDETDDPLGPPANDGAPASSSDVGNVARATILGLTPGTRHHLAVVAYSSVGTGPLSAVATCKAGDIIGAPIVGPVNVHKGGRYSYELKLKWNNGATTMATSRVKWRLNRAGLRRAAIGWRSGKLFVRRRASLGWAKIVVRYHGKIYKKSIRVVTGSSARGAELGEGYTATPLLLYRLSSRLTRLGAGRDTQRRGGRLFADPIASQYSAIVIWRDGPGNRFYQRQDWHGSELADYVVDGPDDSTIQVVATLSAGADALRLRQMRGRTRELTLADLTLDAARRYRGVETTLDADGAAYATGPLLARLDGRGTRRLAEAGTDFETAVADFIADLEERGFLDVPAVSPKRHVAPPAADGVLVYRQRRRLAVVGNSQRLVSHRGGFLVIDLANNLTTAISTRIDAADNRFYARQDWHADADLSLNYQVTGRQRALLVLGALSSATDADGLTDFDLIDLKGGLTRGGGAARLLQGRLQIGSAAGAYFGNGTLNARLDARRTQAATGDHAEAVAALISWLEERGYTAE